jgi:hypothetical protein
MSLTISSYLRGHRTAEGYWIRSNPFYNAAHHRYSATVYVQLYAIPVLRDSSVDGYYAVTHMNHGRVIHTLLRQNADGSVDVMTESGAVQQHFATLYAVLDTVLTQMGCVATSVVAVTPETTALPSPATTVRTQDPIEVVVYSEDPTA